MNLEIGTEGSLGYQYRLSTSVLVDGCHIGQGKIVCVQVP